MVAALFLILTLVASLFLILLILIQRGKGGGLAGAFGGMGGQSAFGAKAGPITKVTIYVALAWFILCAVSVRHFNRPDTTLDTTLGSDLPPITDPGVNRPPGQAAPVQTGTAAPGGEAPTTPPTTTPSPGDATPTDATPSGESPTE